MAYRDDFYTVENIIGITGPVNQLPTVYFRDSRTGEYGHITQVHGYDWNAGRTEVIVDRGWRIVNQCLGGCNCKLSTAHEIDGKGRCFHPSRNKFIPRANLSPSEFDVVKQAIWNCPYMKTDPMTTRGRIRQDGEYQRLWNELHATTRNPGASRGRRGAIDYTASGLANRVYGIVYPNRV
jgi:hypothetical protein